jgi:hypothetical protein
MSEFAGYLLAAGITSSRFQKISKQAYFQAAARNATFRNRRVNQSAVAAKTGLTRVQIREFAKSSTQKVPEELDPLEELIRGWETDPSFTTAESMPKRLAILGRNSAFSLLVKKYGRNRPNRPTINELVRLGFATCDGRFIQLKRPPTRHRAHLQQLLRTLQKLIGRAGDNTKPVGLRAVIKEVTYPSSSRRGRELLTRKALQSAEVFLSDLQAAGLAASIETPLRSAPKISRARLLLLTEEIEQRYVASQPRGLE